MKSIRVKGILHKKRLGTKKGFTLIELLAVITIMGILMLVAIPTVSRVIENSRRDILVDSAKAYANIVRNMWTADEFTCNGVKSSAVPDGDYYVLINTNNYASEKIPKLLESGGKSPWGNQDVNGYVRINISTKPAQDRDGDGVFEVDPIRVAKYYVALSDGLHGVIDDGNTVSGNLSKKDVNLHLTEDELKMIELTTDEGDLDCGIDANGNYSCAEIRPIKNITGICVDDQTSVGLTGNLVVPVSFAVDDWSTIVAAIENGNHPYHVGDTKEIDMGSFGKHTLRLANLSIPAECNNSGFSHTACGTVIEFADIITKYKMNDTNTNVGGWPVTKMRTYLNNDIYNVLPSELKSIIIDTNVISGHGRTTGEVNFISTDKLYLLSTAEVWAQGPSNVINSDTARDNTRPLDYYSDVTSNSYLKLIKKYNDSNDNWWLRASNYYVTTGFSGVYSGIEVACSWGYATANTNFGVSPAFRIG